MLEGPVVRCSEWHKIQPIPPFEGAPNSNLPRAICCDTAAWAEVLVSLSAMHRAAPLASTPLLYAHWPGAPFRRINKAKFSIAEDTRLAVLEGSAPGPAIAGT